MSAGPRDRRRGLPTPASAPTATPARGRPGVIAVGVGGLEGRTMLGAPPGMRLPRRRRGANRQPQPGITATDLVLSLTEFLRQREGVGAYLEFFGEGAAAPARSATGPPSPTWRRSMAPPRPVLSSTSRPRLPQAHRTVRRPGETGGNLCQEAGSLGRRPEGRPVRATCCV